MKLASPSFTGVLPVALRSPRVRDATRSPRVQLTLRVVFVGPQARISEPQCGTQTHGIWISNAPLASALFGATVSYDACLCNRVEFGPAVQGLNRLLYGATASQLWVQRTTGPLIRFNSELRAQFCRTHFGATSLHEGGHCVS